jgi:hypothetical protein
VEKIDTMMAFMDQDKFVSFATLIPHIEFVFPNQFNIVVECKFFFFLFQVLPKVIQELVHVSHARVYPSTLEVKFSPTKGD